MISNDNQSTPRQIILRSTQIDTEYITHLQQKIIQFIESLSRFSSFNVNSEKAEILSIFTFYFSSYILRNVKATPGEEYSGIFKIFSTDKKWKILGYVLALSLQKFGMNIVHNILCNSIERHAQKAMREDNSSPSDLFSKMIIRISKILPSFDDLMSSCEEAQLCYFFLKGYFFDISRILFGFNYSIISKDSIKEKEIIDSGGFKLLGYITFAKLSLELYTKIKSLYRIYQQEKKNLQLEASQSKKERVQCRLKSNARENRKENTCILCLGVRTDTSVTPCGHLFCWKCIVTYLQSNPSCPFCRNGCLPQQVVSLQNYQE